MMGCSFSAITNDEDDYERLLEKYGEKQNGDCYGVHSRWLDDKDRGRTTKSFAEYAKDLKIKGLEWKIEKKQTELDELKKQLEAEQLTF